MAAGVSLLRERPYSISGARDGEISTDMETGRSVPLGCPVLRRTTLMGLSVHSQHQDPHSKVHQDGGDAEARHSRSHAVLHGMWRESL